MVSHAQRRIDIIHKTNAIRRKNEARRILNSDKRSIVEKVGDWIGGVGHSCNQAIGEANCKAIRDTTVGLAIKGVKALAGIPYGKNRRMMNPKAVPMAKKFRYGEHPLIPIEQIEKQKKAAIERRKKLGCKKGDIISYNKEHPGGKCVNFHVYERERKRKAEEAKKKK